jgi:hypothetical protein
MRTLPRAQKKAMAETNGSRHPRHAKHDGHATHPRTNAQACGPVLQA